MPISPIMTSVVSPCSCALSAFLCLSQRLESTNPTFCRSHTRGGLRPTFLLRLSLSQDVRGTQETSGCISSRENSVFPSYNTIRVIYLVSLSNHGQDEEFMTSQVALTACEDKFFAFPHGHRRQHLFLARYRPQHVF